MQRIDGWRRMPSRTLSRLFSSRRAKERWQLGDRLVQDYVRRNVDLDMRLIAQINNVLELGEASCTVRVRRKRLYEGNKKYAWEYPQADRVPELLNRLMDWYAASKNVLRPIELAGQAYHHLVTIHPFDNGNGRTARLVADWILQRNGLPPSAMNRDEAMLPIFDPDRGAQSIEWAVMGVANGVVRSYDICDAF
jgi:hypothetical protein